MELAGKVAWVTGAASGIGRALAHRLAAEKMKLALVDVAPIDEGEYAGTEVLALRCDVGKGAEVAAAAAKAQERFGVVHLIVNNAGIGGTAKPLWKQTEDEWKTMLDINLWGVIHGIRTLLPPLLESGEAGHVVNTASMAGLITTPYLGPYSVAKFGVVAMSECLAKELELSRAKVGVSVLCPGFVKTNIGGPPVPGNKLAQAVAALIAGGQPPEKVADAVVAAVKESRFYILTHPEMKGQIEHRMKQVIEEKQPGIDPLIRSLLG